MRLRFCQGALFACLLFPLWEATASSADIDSQRKIYIAADSALKNHDRARYEQLKSKIPDYPLYPYLVYEELKQKIQHSKPMNVSIDALNNFQKQAPDFPFHGTLRNLWLTEVAKSKNWATYIKGYRPTPNEALQCQYHFAQYKTTNDPKHLAKAKDLWLVGYTQEPACDALFSAWKKNGGITPALLNQRIKLALQNKEYDLVSYLSKSLSAKEKLWIEEWKKLAEAPNLLLSNQYLQKLNIDKKIKGEIVSRTINELTKRDAQKIARWWDAYQNDVGFTDAQMNQIRRDIAVSLAQQRSPQALDWLASLSKDAQDSVAKEWQIRLNIANEHWHNVIHYIGALPPALKEDSCWQYWLARAKEQLGQTEQAKAIYQTLANTRGYYGFLSSTRLNQPLNMQYEPLHINAEQYSKLFNKPAIKRFEELRRVNKEAVARVEWFRAIDKMTPDELDAAAKIAHNMGLHDIAIFTLSKSPHKDDISLRFPLAHEAEIFNHANQYDLEPAWIFAIARQESAFHEDAISRAGARGLMQLLPSTAKLVAQQHNIAYSSEADLHKPAINVELGSAYLKNLKERMYNNLILATASYNAGPGRIPRWLYDDPMETDRWIENIPYKETREYVKNVMTFMSIYQEELGNAANFNMLLKFIPKK